MLGINILALMYRYTIKFTYVINRHHKIYICNCQNVTHCFAEITIHGLIQPSSENPIILQGNQFAF